MEGSIHAIMIELTKNINNQSSPFFSRLVRLQFWADNLGRDQLAGEDWSLFVYDNIWQFTYNKKSSNNNITNREKEMLCILDFNLRGGMGSCTK